MRVAERNSRVRLAAGLVGEEADLPGVVVDQTQFGRVVVEWRREDGSTFRTTKERTSVVVEEEDR